MGPQPPNVNVGDASSKIYVSLHIMGNGSKLARGHMKIKVSFGIYNPTVLSAAWRLDREETDEDGSFTSYCGCIGCIQRRHAGEEPGNAYDEEWLVLSKGELEHED